MITSLPWQHQIIVAEFWVAAFYFIHMTHQYNGAKKKYGPKQIGWVVSDIAMIGLLLWGGTEGKAWAYLIVFGMYALSILGMSTRIRTEAEVTIPKHSTGVTVVALIIATLQTLILVSA
jgi:hypothetical protein